MLLTALSLLVVAAPGSGAAFVPGELVAGEFLPSESESQRFKTFFDRGEELYRQGEFGAAIWNFQEADRQRVTPEVAFDLAKCFEKIQDVPMSVFYYRLYLRRAPNASDAIDIAALIGSSLSKAEAQGRVFLELEAPRADRVSIAGKSYPEPPVALFLPPGQYEVEAVFPSGIQKMMVDLRLGRTTTTTFEPVPPPLMAASVPLSSRMPLTDPAMNTSSSATQGSSGARVASYVIGGLGLAALATAVALGVSSQNDATSAMDHAQRVSTALSSAQSATTKGVVATVLYGVGGAALAGGIVLFVVSIPEPGKKPAETSR